MNTVIVRLPANSNLIITCDITGAYDVNRNTTLEDDIYKLVRN